MTTPAEYLDWSIEWSKTMGRKQSDYLTQTAFEACVADRKAQSSADFARAQAATEHRQMMEYIGIGTAISLLIAVIVVILLRRPIWRIIEGLFISSAAKTITTKRDLTAYKDDVARRIREKVDNK